jgi:phosphoribosyl 1,2-cyclic phosphodiesterase
LKVRFWGTRGSLPQATSHADILLTTEKLLAKARHEGIQTLRTFELWLRDGKLGFPLSFGGNTSCTEILHQDQSVFVDMGSGLREAGTHYMAKGQKHFHIFLTHMHWDHIMGLPFFIPVHAPGCTTTIYHVHRNAPEHVKINFNGVNFPLTFDQLGGKLEFKQLKLYQPEVINGLSVTPFVLDHPGGSFGFRFDAAGQSAVVGVDGEFKRVSEAELGADLKYYQNLDLLIFDAQYEMSELASRFDWGHSSPTIGVDLALREGIRTLVLTHHDPWSSSDRLLRMHSDAEYHRSAQLPAFKDVWTKLAQVQGPRIISAYDGLELDVASLNSTK